MRASDAHHLVSTAPVSASAFRDWATLADRDINFAPREYTRADAEEGWHVDHRAGTLGREVPGAPCDDGPFAVARQAMIGYAFADPRLVRAVYDANAPFDGRDMLLVGRFLFLRFHMGVRVGGVEEGPTELDGRRVHRFDWHYRTLEGHLEQGQMAYRLLKWADSGCVEVRIHAYSRRGHIDNPVVRLGFALFARPTQLAFYDRSISRLQESVAEHATSGVRGAPGKDAPGQDARG